jgi:hypothetical protein
MPFCACELHPHQATCGPGGACVCAPGYAGVDCTQACGGNGVIMWPGFNATFTMTMWDARYGPNLKTNFTSAGGLFNTSALYGTVSGVSVMAVCVCKPGFTGPFCTLACPACSMHGACVTNATGGASCACSATDASGAATTSALARAAGLAGVGWSGPLCDVPCKPCANGTCDARGECACLPGFTDDACALECGAEGVDAATGKVIGKRGTVYPLGALPGYGIRNSTAVCVCDAGWAGAMCTKPCPFPYDTAHGICALKNASDSDYGAPWSAAVVCAAGWAGRPPVELRLPASSPGAPGRNCSVRCSPCASADGGGVCQDGGECLCAYDRLWQGPLLNVQGTYPYPQLRLPRDVFNASYHSCAVRHPCSANGEYINATCAGTVLAGTGTPWMAAAPLDGGWGCTDVSSPAFAAGCANGTQLFAMAYAEVDAATGLAVRRNPPAATFTAAGTIQGGVCLPPAGAAASELPLRNGVCRCDGLARGRFKFPSSALLPSGSYDYDFQGWAGPSCAIPCAPCSINGICAAEDGACVCHAGWTGYRCLVPCEPCAHGTCAQDGSCLCAGGRRRKDGTYALRLSRDPFYLERGAHSYEVAGARRAEYVSPAYATAALVEDYLWEVEYECAHRPGCSGRTPDTQLPARPNETYFRYSTPFASGTQDADSPVARLQGLESRMEALKAAVAELPFSLNGSALCDIPGPNVGQPSQGADACLVAMRARLWGRTLASCGPSYDAAQPWTCDDNLKAQFIIAAHAEIGRLSIQRTQVTTNVSVTALSQMRWLLNNRNERQRLLNTQLRGVLSLTQPSWVPVRSPDYYTTWIIHQLLYGVTFGGGYTGWDCSVPCEPCDATGGTCQFDGSCECIPGRYGANCSLSCACSELQISGTVTAAAGSSASGKKIAPGGVCARDGVCACYTDDDGIQWAGQGCFIPCAPCAHGACNATDGTCDCEPGWAGDACNVRPLTDCLPCDASHGTCLSDGTCACDAGWTGLDCATPCRACVHGDCQPDGECFCRPGWAGADCRLHLGAPLARAAFAASPGGWRVLNNSCAPAAPPAPVRGAFDDGGAPAAAAPPGCTDTSPGGDAGLSWDAGTGCLVVVDALPSDVVDAGQIAYLRAPLSFTGNKLGAYGGVLAWNLHIAGDGGDGISTPPGAPHPSGGLLIPDAILIGGLPAFNVTPPAWEQLSKAELLAWSRARFPELRLNGRWSAARVADTLRAYLRTPQVALHYFAAEPARRCGAAECSMNFGAALAPGYTWRNAAAGVPPGAWGWSDSGDAAFVARIEGTPYIGSAAGVAHNPFWFASSAAGAAAVPNGDAAADARLASGTAASGGVPSWTWEQGDTPLSPGPLQAGPGTVRAADADASNAGGVSIDAARAGWDVLPTVYAAIGLARASRAGTPSTFAELAWCLASLREVLLRADYLNATAPAGHPGGAGEATRLDDAALTGPDPFATNASLWEAPELAAYLQYAQRYADDYQSRYLMLYLQAHAAAGGR